jgi:hypothetical protein
MKRHAFHLRFDDPELVDRTRVFPFVHEGTGIPVDVVLAGPGLEEEFLDRAIDVQIEGTVVPVISPEDLIVTKVVAGRPKDIEDVSGVLRERADSLAEARTCTACRFGCVATTSKLCSLASAMRAL